MSNAHADVQTPEIYMLVARPRRAPKPLPVFPNPPPRPEGDLQPLVLSFFSEVSRGVDIALGKVNRRDTAAFLRVIRSAGNRSIHIDIDDSGGDAGGSLAIAAALLQHAFAVHCRISRASSGATFIALAADTRTITETGHVLVHAACRLFIPEQWENFNRLPIAERRAINASLNDTDDAQVALLTQRLGVSEATARQWLTEDCKWDAVSALDRGFVDSIAEMETA